MNSSFADDCEDLEVRSSEEEPQQHEAMEVAEAQEEEMQEKKSKRQKQVPERRGCTMTPQKRVAEFPEEFEVQGGELWCHNMLISESIV